MASDLWESFSSGYGRKHSAGLIMLFALGLQYVVVFLPAIIVPLVHLFKLKSSVNHLGFETIGFACVSAAIATLIIRGHTFIGGGCFLPTTFSTPLFAVSVLAMHAGSIATVMGVGVMVGLFQMVLTPLLFFVRKILNMYFAGFIVLLSGIWVAQTGVVSLLFPDQLSPLMYHSKSIVLGHIDIDHAIIGLLSLLVMLGLRLRGGTKHRVLCLLYGNLFGWVLAAVLGMLDPRILGILKQAPWVQMLSFHYWVMPQMDWRLTVPCAIAALIVLLQVVAMLVLSHNALEEKATTSDAHRYAYVGSIAAGIGLIFTSALGAPQSPNVGGFGAQVSTGFFVKNAAWLFAGILVLFGFCPKLILLFMTIPAAVRGATLLFIGSAMFMYGMQVMQLATMSTFRSMTFAVALLIGAGMSTTQSLYQSNSIWVAGVTNPMFFVAMAIYLVLHLFFERRDGEGGIDENRSE